MNERLRWSPWECAPLHHCGVNMEQSIHGHWHLTQEAFCQEINQVTEDGLTKDLTQHERHQCRAVLGAAQWRCYQSGPQHSSKLSHLQSMLPKGDRNTLKDINRFVKEIYSQKELGITVYDLKATCDEDIVAVGWSDAALANQKMLEGHQGPVSIMSWSTHKLRRVCRSSLAAEAQAFSECEAELMMVRFLWQELLGREATLASPWATSRLTPGVLVVDAKALFDLLQQEDIPNMSAKEKHTALEVLGLSQHLVDQSTILRWCNSDQQLADGMTKVSAQDKITKFLSSGQRWNLVYDSTFTAAKRLRAAGPPLKAEVDSLKDPSFTDCCATVRGM